MHFSRRRCCFNLDTAAKGTGQSCTMPQQCYTARSRANVLEAPNGCVLVAEAATVSGQLCWSCLFDDFSLGVLSAARCFEAKLQTQKNPC